MKLNKLIIFTLLLILVSCTTDVGVQNSANIRENVAQSHDVIDQSDIDKYTLKLHQQASEIKAGKKIEIDKQLASFLYRNRRNFPDTTDSKNNSAKLKKLAVIYSNVSTVYIDYAIRNPKKLNKSSAELLGFLAVSGVRLSELSNDFMSNFDKSDRSYSIRIKGVEQTRNGLIKLMVGMFQAYFVENHGQTVSAILSDSIKESFMPTIKSFPKEKQNQSVGILDAIIKPGIRDSLKKEYLDLLQSI